MSTSNNFGLLTDEDEEVGALLTAVKLREPVVPKPSQGKGIPKWSKPMQSKETKNAPVVVTYSLWVGPAPDHRGTCLAGRVKLNQQLQEKIAARKSLCAAYDPDIDRRAVARRYFFLYADGNVEEIITDVAAVREILLQLKPVVPVSFNSVDAFFPALGIEQNAEENAGAVQKEQHCWKPGTTQELFAPDRLTSFLDTVIRTKDSVPEESCPWETPTSWSKVGFCPTCSLKSESVNSVGKTALDTQPSPTESAPPGNSTGRLLTSTEIRVLTKYYRESIGGRRNDGNFGPWPVCRNCGRTRNN